jgi:hypothetical protein
MGSGENIPLESWIPHDMLQVEWHVFGMPPGYSLVAVSEVRVLLPQAFECRRDERDYHDGDEVGHGNHASCETMGARPMGGEVSDGRVSDMSRDNYGHCRLWSS